MLKTSKLIKLVLLNQCPKKLSKVDKRAIQVLRNVLYILRTKYNFSNKQIHLFFDKLPNKLKKSNHTFYDLVNNNSYAIQGTGKLSKLNRPHWLSNGTEINGQCITTKVGESPQNAKESILSDILLENVPNQYYINKKKLKKILKQ